MKVIFCLHHFLPDFVGGTEIYTLRLAQQLKHNGVEVTMVIPNFDTDKTDEYDWENIRVIKYSENSIEDRKMILGKKEPDGLDEFAAILNREAPDIVHFHELAPGRGISIFHVEKVHDLNIPVVLTFHMSYYSCMKGSLIYKDEIKCDGLIRIKRCTECMYQSKNITGSKAKLLGNTALALFKLGLDSTSLNSSIGTALGFPYVINKIKKDLLRLSSLAEKIVVLAEWYKYILEKNGVPSEKLVYIKQGLTGEIQKPLNHSMPGFPLKVVYIGRITQLKGLHLLIDAICELPEDKISLYIYGQQSEEYAINLEQKSKTKNNIHWMGTVPSEHVIPTLSNYDLLCLPSAFEMSPLVIQEAFAAGIPVLASDVYGNAEQIKEGINGWLFRFRDSKHLTAKLKFLSDNLKVVEDAGLNLPGANMFKEVAGKHLGLYSEITRCQQ